MTLEQQLISKSYYKTLIGDNETMHPMKVLGEMYMAEQQNEVTDLSSIRYSQGEVYFLNKDFEAAIFKWENISNDLKPWAQKNIADAHFELDLLAIAEDYYKAVETDSDVLKTEVLLQLFSLYTQLGKLEKAVHAIKKAVNLNPDYPDVTDMARAFFEDQQDFENAIHLAVKESIRTGSLTWFRVLETYVKMGHTATMEPNYFKEVLKSLYHADQSCFESLTAELWNSYRQNELYFPWLKEINHLLLDMEPQSYHTWKKLSTLYKETYFTLTDGRYLIRDLSRLIPNLLTNWMKICTPSDALISSSATLAWNEIFPSSIDESMISKAQSMVSQSAVDQNVMEDALNLFETIGKWAKDNGVFLSERLEWIIRELQDFNHYHLLVSAAESHEKTIFINNLLGGEFLEPSSQATILFKDTLEAEIHAITDQEVKSISDDADYKSTMKQQDTLISVKTPFSFLNENKIALIDAPGLSDKNQEKNDMLKDLHFADSLVFVLSGDAPLTANQLDMAIQMKEQAPELTMHFVLNKMETSANNEEANELIEHTVSTVNTYFPHAKLFGLSAHDEDVDGWSELSEFIGTIKNEQKLEEKRTTKILYYIKESIKFMLEKRIEMEKAYIEKIKWNEEMVIKLKGAVNQLSDMEEGKIQVINTSYSEIKQKMSQDLKSKIPELIRDSSEIVKEDSNFERIHVELNEEMNHQIFNYIEEKVLPDFRTAIQGWIVESELEFKESQENLHELSRSFNQLYGEEKIALDCDFQVLDDWRRDADRMTRGKINLQKASILTRSTPSQFLFKSAGKLFGALSQNKGMLQNKYKQFIENKDYSETAESITNQFMHQFEIFENSLERDINMFFANPLEVLNVTLEETHNEIEENQNTLSDMRKNPEVYRDPLTLFELKLLQYERMAAADEQIKEYR
ncbi:GTP-binding protein [Oceanobacillus saliphilus]|uniref:GTP-binding protein n=1 Tax=Oceanobacillus saliphilus TaxID=2925834 RepID=UPI00201D7B3E|nr:GTP-binding protein [Oceanobacillus saliphilus]